MVEVSVKGFKGINHKPDGAAQHERDLLYYHSCLADVLTNFFIKTPILSLDTQLTALPFFFKRKALTALDYACSRKLFASCLRAIWEM
jgi:hypothetical protein